MKIFSDKVKATTFAIGKRLQGYHLLKNPKGVPATQVNMIKVTHSFSNYYDDIFNYQRISDTFINGKQKHEYKVLSSVHILDDETAKMTNKRQMHYASETKKNGFKYVERKDIPSSELKQRRDMFNKSKSLFGTDERAMFIAERKEANKARNYYRTMDDVLTKIFTFGYFGNTNKPKRPNFFKVLLSNLNCK